MSNKIEEMVLNIKKVEIVFENCEEVTIDRAYIEKLNMIDIEKGEDFNICNNFEIEINSAILDHTDDKGLYNRYFEKSEDKVSVGQRLQMNDITQIHIYCEDGTKEWFCVDYKEENEGILGSPNLNQKSYVTQYGNLHIAIRKQL